MNAHRTIALSLLAGLVLSPFAAGQQPPSPEEAFGFRMGADRKLVDWEQIAGYFETLGEASGRVAVQELGKTTLGKPFLLAVITSEENFGRLDRYRAIQRKLANPHDLEPGEAEALAGEGRIVVLVSMNIHSTEIASSQESVELAYELATRDDPPVRKILDEVILLLIPSLNPDGLQMVVEWYRQHAGTPSEGCRMPWLYHPYAGHDNNRDWFMFNLEESRLTAPVLYQEWFPEIVLDQHQMGSSGARLFIPPYADPVNPNVHSTLMAQVNMLGKHAVADLHAQGFRGVVTGARFNAFFEGTMSKTPLWHNMVGILSEMASVRIATPLYFPRGSLGKYGPELPRYSRVTDFLEPWEGGWWRLRDIIEYEKALTYSVLDLAATYRKKFMMTFHALNAEAIERGRSEPPFAYIVPLAQHDPGCAAEMLKRLAIGGVEIFRSRRPFEHGGLAYPEDTFIIPLAQPCRPYIKDLLEPQRYPDLKVYPGGPPLPPYDATGWTLPLQMGVDVVAADLPLEAELFPAGDIEFEPFGVADSPARYYLVERRFNHAFTLLNILLKEGVEVCWAEAPFSVEGRQYPAGTLVIPGGEGIDARLQALSEELMIQVGGANEPIDVDGRRAAAPRLGLYQPWTASMDEGWTRLVLDWYRFDYESLHNDEMKKGGLQENYDAIILPDLSTEGIVEGKGRRYDEPLVGEAEMPEEYRGGIGKKGVEALSAFVKSGGTLIAFSDACDFAIDELKLPAVNVLKDLEREEYYAPGSLLRIHLDTAHPLAFGMRDQAAVRITQCPAFRLLPYIRESRAVGFFEDGNPLLSGWLIGPEKIAGMTALAEIPVGKGRVILFGFRVQNRAQTFGTFKLLFNAIVSSRAEPLASLEAVTK